MSLEVSNLKLEKSTCKPGEWLMITFTITNTKYGYVIPKYTITANGSVVKEDYSKALGFGESADVADMIQAPTSPGVYSVCVSVSAYYAM